MSTNLPKVQDMIVLAEEVKRMVSIHVEHYAKDRDTEAISTGIQWFANSIIKNCLSDLPLNFDETYEAIIATPSTFPASNLHHNQIISRDIDNLRHLGLMYGDLVVRTLHELMYQIIEASSLETPENVYLFISADKENVVSCTRRRFISSIGFLFYGHGFHPDNRHEDYVSSAGDLALPVHLLPDAGRAFDDLLSLMMEGDSQIKHPVQDDDIYDIGNHQMAFLYDATIPGDIDDINPDDYR